MLKRSDMTRLPRGAPLRSPDDPAFDPKKDAMDFIRLALGPGVEEMRSLKTTPELEALFIEQGFSPFLAQAISMAVVQHLLKAFPRKRGRPWPTNHRELIELQATHLAQIKSQLRAKGQKGSVHKKAMQILETEHEKATQRIQAEFEELPPLLFDYDAIENYVRRSKKRRTK
jgi:hypothetical protein